MDEHTIRHIFDPFFTTKEVGKGTGLGLASVHGAVAQSDGLVQVESTLNEGSTFKIYLPVVTDSPAPKPEPVHDADTTRSPKILVVEDDHHLNTIVCQVLRRSGYNVVAAQSYHEALDLAQTHTDLDAVLTDVVMPGGNGSDLVAQLHSQDRHIKVMFMSGHTRDEMVHRGVREGVAFLQKPFGPATLRNRLATLLNS